jgi:hypothetical protein
VRSDPRGLVTLPTISLLPWTDIQLNFCALDVQHPEVINHRIPCDYDKLS